MNKICIIIAGPTATGKTHAAIELARNFNTQIISADSRQCYTELNAGVAKPSPLYLNEIHHYFINSHSILQEVNAKVFENYALESAASIFKNNDVAIMVGGTGLYIKAFCESLDEVPVTDLKLRERISQRFMDNGIEWLQSEIEKNDPLFFLKGEIQNPQRMVRALEVKYSTGRSILEFQSKNNPCAKPLQQRYFKIIKLGMEIPRDKIYLAINNRVDEMMDKDLLAEVNNLLPYRDLNALQTVGYKELFDHLEGRISLQKAIEAIKTNTRHYAKRQITWFKKDPEISWFNPADKNEMLGFIEKKMHSI
ncbi:MAG: tRNA (adenosine(37)-N6)-dimethylallyltransferase MiaA [Chitinophagaceae bacterium]|nr:tRNA (adenosine(37)-N6)-dimethylallyltransferase MiaA [Chitinophagaceae bacterium]